jgi:TPR repeat protein
MLSRPLNHHPKNEKKMIRPLFSLLVIAILSLNVSPLHAQDDNDIIALVGKLRNLSILFIETDTEKMIERQKEKIELAEKILDHPDMEEAHRIFAMISRIQAFGIHFNTLFRDKKLDQQLNESYEEAIEEGLDDEDQRVVIEATTSQASFRCGLFIIEPNDESAQSAADALEDLSELGPKDPLVQATKRLLLEQLWNSDHPKKAFEAIGKVDDKVAQIVLDQIEGETDKEKAEFLWAKHFSRFGDFVAQRRLAEMYESGKGTKINNAQSARWYTKLARLGDRYAQIKLGDFYLEGKGYSKDEKAAVQQYQAAAKNGSRVAQFKLGQCYRNGSGVEQSESDWRKWIKSAASNANGRDVQTVYNAIDFKDAAESYQIFYEALVEQNSDNYYYLNNFSYSLLIAENKNPQRALELIEKAIEYAPDDFDGIENFLDTKATALKQMGQYKKAAELFESVLEKLDDKEPVLKSLIECYEELGDEEKADSYQKQLEGQVNQGK